MNTATATAGTVTVRRKRTVTPRRAGRVRRSAAEWTVRGMLAVTAAAAGLHAVTFSLAQTLAGRDAALAHRLAPYDGPITARLAASLAGADADAVDQRRADALARLALRQDPTAVSAVSTIGINAQLRGDVAAARRFLGYADTLSRRHAQTQLWAIEDAVSRGNVAGTLRRYDIALRVSPTLSEILYPVLASVSGDPAIQPALIRTLAAKPAWAESFIGFVPGNTPDSNAAAALLLGLRRAGVPVPQAAHAGAIAALLARRQADAAWHHYAAIHPGADRRRSRDPRFAADTDAPSPFDWVPVDDGAISGSIQREGEGGVFDFAAPAGVGGPMLRQVQMLPPGAYRMTGRSSGIDQAVQARPYWVLSCPDGRELGHVALPNSGETGSDFAGTFQVPAGCPVQTLALVARPSEAVSGLAGRIDRAELVPAG